VRPLPSQSGPRWWCRPILKVAATPCRCASTTIRLCESATLSETQGTRCSRLLRPSRLKPSRSHTAHSVRCATVKVAGGGPSVHACAMFLGAKSRHGDKFNQTPGFLGKTASRTTRRGALINGNPSQQRVALVTRLVVDLEDGLALVSRELRPVALPLETLPRLASTGEYRSTLTARLARSPVEAAACSLGLPPVA
jgi:hypothetical protein